MHADGGSALSLRLQGDDETAAEELDRLTARLRRELLDLDVLDVRRAAGPGAPEGTRGLDAAGVGTLLVSLVTAPEVLRAVVGTIRDWLRRNRAGSVYIEDRGDVLQVTGLSSEGQDRLIDAWIARHAER